MEANRQRQRTGYQLCSIVAGLLLLLLGTGAWSLGPGLHAADLGEVLAQIGQQAGIRISAGPSAGKKVSARFADVELEEGLRRLLRLASLSHLFLYSQGPAGTVAIAEVRVVGEGSA